MNSSAAWRQFICRACGLVYDEAQGDEDSGLLPGTRFEDIPDDWACPLCGVTKADFEPYDPSPLPPRSGVDSTAARTIVFDGAARITGRPRLGAPRSTTPAGQGTVVVVGGGTAAWTLVERIRQIDAERPITMVTACSADRYDKPRLSVAFRQGVAPADLPLETGAAAAKRLRVHLMAQTFAIGVDPARRRLRTTHGALDYGELVLAHGAQTRQCPGLPDDLTWRINDLGSYARLRQALNAAGPAASVLLVGAGLVGCELANDLALAGHRVTLIESAERPLPMATGAQSHELLKAWSGLPIRFLGGRRVRLATRGGLGEPIRLELQDGSVVTGHVLISAVGLATPSRLAQQAGLKWDQGIAVDRTSLSTGVAGIHALGDCISIDGAPQRFIEPIRRQASIVAARLLGLDPAPYDAAPPPIRVKTSSLPLTLN